MKRKILFFALAALMPFQTAWKRKMILKTECLKNHPEEITSCASFRFRSIHLKQVKDGDLRDTDFQEAQLQAVVFENVRFRDVNFKGARLSNVIFRNCRFENVDFSGARLLQVRFNSCDLQATDFEFAYFLQSDFHEGSGVQGLNFNGCISTDSFIRRSEDPKLKICD